MKNCRLSSRAPLAMLGLTFCLSSCALPPREAWRVIQRDGLIPYFAIEAGKRPIPPYVQRTNLPVSQGQSAKQNSVRVSAAPKPAQVASAVPQTRFLATPEAVAAAPRAIVRAQEPPKAAAHPKPRPAHRAAAAPASPPLEFRRATPSQQRSVTVPAPKPQAKSPPAPSRVAQTPKPKADTTPAPRKTETPKADSTKKTAAAPKTLVAPKPAAAPTVDIPYGNAVPGRPGLVTSPYAGKLQLVDVTGLSPGQEVKCPYSGKLFRVPPSQQAASKPPQPAADVPPAKKNP